MGATALLATTAVVVTAGGATAAGPVLNTNPAPITIVDATYDDDLGAAVPAASTPYGSTILVGGVPGTVSDVSVTLNGLSHGAGGDIDAVLVGPSGQRVTLLSDKGGSTNALVTFGGGNYTFQDGAPAMPVTYTIPAGTYAPSDDSSAGADTYPAPAPGPGTSSSLADLDGTDPNGSWRLFVVDDTDGDTGAITGGWSLSVTTVETPVPGALQFTQTTRSVPEGAGTVNIPIERVGGSAGPVAVQVTSAYGTAGIADLFPVAELVTFEEGQTSATVPVTIRDDADVEGPETFTLTLSGPQSGATLGSPTVQTITIVDDDAPANPGGITIPQQGMAAPYPSQIAISGRTGAITDVDVTLTSLQHTHPNDVAVLLVSPTGASTVLLAGTGGSGDANATLTFDDDAPGSLPASDLIVSGTYRPSVAGTAPTFPAPAPAGPHGTSLAAFDGTAANGLWSLYVLDSVSGDAGSIASWNLDIETVSAAVDGGGPYTTAEGASVSLAASASGFDTTPSFAWDLDGDGSYDDATGSSPILTWPQLEALGLGDGPVTRTIGVRADDGAGATATDTADLTVTNAPPTGTISAPSTVTEGSTATVSVVSPSDPSAADRASGLRFAYDVDDDGTWDIGDGTYAGGSTSASATVPATALDDNGTAQVSVRIIDKDGGVAVRTATISVTNVAPTATLTGSSVTLGESATVTFTAQTDPSTADTAAGFTYAYDLDDDGTWDITGSTSSTATVPASTLDSLGDHTVRARITDKDGGSTTYTTTVTVGASTPTATLTNNGPVPEGSPATVTFTGQTDTAPGATFTYDYDYDNDGTWDITDTTSSTATVPATVLDDDGSHTVTARIKNQYGGSRTLTTTITVTNVAPTATFAGPTAVYEGAAPATVSISSVEDPSGADSLAGFTYEFDLDDDGTIEASSTTATFVVPADRLDDGTATALVRVRVIDKDGGASSYLREIQVLNVAPTATLTGDSVALGEDAFVAFIGAADPSDADTTAGFTYDYDLDDDGTWDITGSTSSTATVPASTLDTLGDHTVRARITDKDGGSTTYTTTVTVGPSTPTATLTNNGPVPEGSPATVTFTGQTDTAPDATFTYDYDYDNDGTWDLTDTTSATATVPATVLDDNGTHTVTARIKNQYGGSRTLTTAITVTNVAPTATLDADATTVGADAALRVVDATDPSGADTTAGFTFRFDLDGDGVVETASSTSSAATVPGSRFTAPGTYPVAAEITDKDGGATTVTAEVTVTTSLPTATFGNDGPVDEGGTATVSFTDQADPAGGPFTYRYDLDGDGTFDLVDVAEATASVPAELTADGDATIEVTGRITNRFGGFVDHTTTVEVRDVAPTLTVTDAPDGATVGVPVEIGVQVTDPSDLDGVEGFTIEADWDGDGTIDGPTLPAGPNGIIAGPATRAAIADAVLLHTFTAPGTYTVRLTALDRNGVRSEAATVELTVAAAPTTTTTSTSTPTGPTTTTPTGTTVPGGTDPGGPDGDLVRTGSETSRPVLIGGLLLAAGLLLTGFARQRRLTR